MVFCSKNVTQKGEEEAETIIHHQLSQEKTGHQRDPERRQIMDLLG